MKVSWPNQLLIKFKSVNFLNRLHNLFFFLFLKFIPLNPLILAAVEDPSKLKKKTFNFLNPIEIRLVQFCFKSVLNFESGLSCVGFDPTRPVRNWLGTIKIWSYHISSEKLQFGQGSVPVKPPFNKNPNAFCMKPGIWIRIFKILRNTHFTGCY